MRLSALLAALVLAASLVFAGCLTREDDDDDADDRERQPDDGTDGNETENMTGPEGGRFQGQLSNLDRERNHTFEIRDGHELLAWEVTAEGSLGGDVEVTLVGPNDETSGGEGEREGNVTMPMNGTWTFRVRLSEGVGAAYQIAWCAGDSSVTPQGCEAEDVGDDNRTAVRRF